jgi:hypothetical protein
LPIARLLFANQNFMTAGFHIPLLPFTQPMARDFVYGYAQQANLSIDRKLARNIKISVSYSYTHALHLNRARDMNTPDPGLLALNLRNALAAGMPFSPPLAWQWLTLALSLVVRRVDWISLLPGF